MSDQYLILIPLKIIINQIWLVNGNLDHIMRFKLEYYITINKQSCLKLVKLN